MGGRGQSGVAEREAGSGARGNSGRDEGGLRCPGPGVRVPRIVALLQNMQARAPKVDETGGPVIAVLCELAHNDPESGPPVLRSRGRKTIQLPRIMEQLARSLLSSAPGCFLV